MAINLPKKNLVIFDCDGVLVDSEHLSNLALVHCLAELQIEMSIEDAVHKFKGRNLVECFSEIELTHRVSLPDAFPAQFRALRSEYFESKLKPIKGVSEALARIPNAKCVASNGPPQMIKRNLEITGLSQNFGENLFSAYTIQKWKPEPDLFLHASRKMGIAPSDCIVIEDTETGVQAAIAGGFKVLAFGFEPSQSSNAISFYNMDELPRLIDGSFGS